MVNDSDSHIYNNTNNTKVLYDEDGIILAVVEVDVLVIQVAQNAIIRLDGVLALIVKNYHKISFSLVKMSPFCKV